MNVIIGCECSGVTREAFRRLGHNAWSVDLMPADDNSPYHIQGNVLEWVAPRHMLIANDCNPSFLIPLYWDAAIFMPPCTYLANAQVHLLDEKVEYQYGKWKPRRELREEALELVKLLLSAPIPKIALENPRGYINSQIRTHDQVVRPWEHGQGVQKEICLWLKNLPKLKPTNVVPGRRSSWWGLSPSADRQKIKGRSFEGVAEAMARQWGI